MPRIAYLCLQATNEGQASYAHVHEIIGGLRALGWDVDLFEPAYAGSGSAPGGLGRLSEFGRVQRRLERALESYDAVYVRSHALAWRAARAASRAGVPVIQECNGPYDDLFVAWPAARVARPLLIAMARGQFRDATRVIAVTPELAEWLRDETGRPDASVVPNGANTELFAPTAQPREGLPVTFACFFGAMAPWQGVGCILEALDDPSWPRGLPVVFAGDGVDGERVRAAAATDKRVIMLGSLPYAEVPSVVAASVCSLIPKSSDTHTVSGLAPLKLFESMACGVPVVVSRTGGLERFVEECECGLSFPPGDAAALARAVSSIVSYPIEAAAMGARGRTSAVERHSWQARAADTAAVITSAIEARRH